VHKIKVCEKIASKLPMSFPIDPITLLCAFTPWYKTKGSPSSKSGEKPAILTEEKKLPAAMSLLKYKTSILSETVAVSSTEYVLLFNESTNLTVSKMSEPEQGKGDPPRQTLYVIVAADASEKNKKLKKIKKPTIKTKETLLLNFFLRTIIIKNNSRIKAMIAKIMVFS
jgi:hypothetical protein